MTKLDGWVRGTNPTQRRLFLLANGWQRGRNDSDWSHPVHGGGHTLAAAVRLALGGSK